MLGTLARCIPTGAALTRAVTNTSVQRTSVRAAHKAQHYIDTEERYGCHNYAPIPAVVSRGKGEIVWDVEGNELLDFLSAYSAVNQGHCHPRLVKVMQEQCATLTLTSRAFYNNKLGDCEKFLAERFGYDKVLMMNSGVEAGESAVKLARKWAYSCKGVPDNQAVVLFANNNFWGRSIAAVSSSSDPLCYEGFGPYTPGFELIDYNDLNALEQAIQRHNGNVCAFYVEPIQGEAGVVVPDNGYIASVRKICTDNNVLFIADEVQSGLGRTGAMLAVDHESVRPDMVVLGKALSGGMMPVSAVLADDFIMNNIHPGMHGSTYGGNPLASSLAVEAIKVLDDEQLVQRSAKLGELFRERLGEMKYKWIQQVRGKGLFNAVVLDPKHKVSGKDICYKLLEGGLLAKQTHEHIIRFAPPLVISEQNVERGCEIIKAACKWADQ